MSQQATAADLDAYDLGDVLPHDVDSLPAGTNLLLSGPVMTGKGELALDVLRTGAAGGESAVVVSPDRSAERIVDGFGETERLWVVDCSGSSGTSFEDSDRVTYVSSPGDLTGIGIGIAKATRRIGPEVRNGLRLSVLSVSTLLQYVDQERVFNFLHVLTGRVSAGSYLGVYAIDPTAHEQATVNVITSQFDGALDVREGDDGRECRLRGFPDVDREWLPF